ncbi:hypothetical protein LCGC14_0411940 [marine sediment metagenome]|uniref:Uncharacterized protein n=1 Tax=marine sediment metagenome TaxID=412755 RepID=A0A0F9TBR2_9ZZZZ
MGSIKAGLTLLTIVAFLLISSLIVIARLG